MSGDFDRYTDWRVLYLPLGLSDKVVEPGVLDS